MLWSKFGSLPAFVKWAVAAEFWKKDLGAVLPHGQTGINHWTENAFNEFLKTLNQPLAVALAKLLYGLMTTQFDLVILDHAQAHPDGGDCDYTSLANFMRGEGNETALTITYKQFTSALAGQASAIPDGPEDGGSAIGERLMASLMSQHQLGEGEESIEENLETKKDVFEKLVADKDRQIRFHALPNLPAGPMQNFMAQVELNKALSQCPFHLPAVGGQEKKQRAWLISGDLFPGCMATGAQDFRLPTKFFEEMTVPEGLKSLWKWIKSVRKPEDAIIVCDGRFPQVRRFFDMELSELGQRFLVEHWNIYEKPLALDPRYPKRELAFSNCNRETVMVYRPVHKKKNKAVTRTSFNACGEKSSFDLTYTKVPLRSLGELPKVTTTDKRKMLGSEMDLPLSYPGQPLAADGVPFAWAETKSVDWWVTLFKEPARWHD